MCRHWAAATSGVQAMGFSSAGIGVFWVAAMGFSSVGIGVFVVAAMMFLCVAVVSRLAEEFFSLGGQSSGAASKGGQLYK